MSQQLSQRLSEQLSQRLGLRQKRSNRVLKFFLSFGLVLLFPLSNLTALAQTDSNAAPAAQPGKQPSTAAKLAPNSVPEIAVSPARTEDSAEVPPTSKSENSILASSATVLVASDYIYRGISQTFGHPTIQGSLDFAHSTGLGFGIFSSNINLGKDPTSPAQSEVDAYFAWNKEFQAWKTGLMILSSNYIHASETTGIEYSAFVEWKNLKIDFAFMPTYFGVNSTSTYLRLTATLPIQPRDSLILAVGHSYFSQPMNVGFTSYSDLKAGINHTVDGWGLELDWSATDRKFNVGGVCPDQAVVASLGRTFE